jgi:hypothetical protein
LDVEGETILAQVSSASSIGLKRKMVLKDIIKWHYLKKQIESEECFEDVCIEFDIYKTAFFTWYQIKLFIFRIEEHDFE